MSALHNAAELIDCDDERSLFSSIVKEAECVRLLAICVGEKRGKSSLLNWFEHEAQVAFGVPAASVEFKNLEDPSHYGFAEALVAGLRDFGLGFPEFDRLDGAFAERDWSAFVSRSSAGHGQVNATGAQLTESFTAGTVGNAFLGGQHQHIEAPPREWTGQQKEIARRACADAFLDDLRTITANQQVLLLVDTWERCPPVVKSWLQKRLLLKHVLGKEPTRLTVVVAGQEIPPVANGADSIVRTLDSLNLWNDDHIRKYLELRGAEADDSDVATIRRGLHERGWTFDDLESFISLITKGRR
jgi:hypothetical protein